MREDFHDPAPERPDKCPTCGSDDPAEYASPCDRALYSDDRSDPFHRSHEGVPSRVGFHGNVVAPKPQGLDAVSGDGTWDEADERYAAAIDAPSPDNRKLTTLREAVEACAEALGAWEMSSKPSDPTIAQGLLRAGDKARRALASLDEQESA